MRNSTGRPLVLNMGDGPSDGRRLLLIVLGAGWLMSFLYAFFAFASVSSDASVATRSEAYLGWQGVAGVMAVAIFGVGLAWERGSPTRKLSIAPLMLAFLQGLSVTGFFFWSNI